MYISAKTNIGGVPLIPNGRQILAGNVIVYMFKGKKHRDRGPAEIRPDGYEAWFKKGLRHRRNGPAVINPKKKIKEYWEEGKLIRKEFF